MRLFYTAVVIFLIVELSACGNKQEDLENQSMQYLKSAEQLTRQGQLRSALVQARNVIRVTPDSAQGYLQIARIYNQIGYYSEVEKLISNKLGLMPELSYELAFSYFQRKKYRSALDTLALSSVQQDQAFRLLRARCYLHLDENNEYDMEVRKIAAFAEGDGYLSFAKAEKAFIDSDWKQAETLYSQIDSSSELYVQSLIRLADLNIRQSRFESAEKDLTIALSSSVNADTLTVEKANILTMLVQMLIQQGRSGEAYMYQKILATANPQLDSMKSRFDDAVTLYSQGEVEKSKTLLTELHNSFPNNSNVTTLLGVIAFQEGHDQEAEEYLSEVIDPETATPGLIQASSLLKARNNKIDDAIELLKNSVHAQPKNAKLLATYGLALLQQNPIDRDGAMALEKSVAMDPEQQRLRLALAERHYRLNEKEQGLAQLETAYRKAPLDRVIVQTYFHQLSLDKDDKAVVTEIEQLKKKFPRSFQVDLIEAWWLFEQEQFQLAESKLIAMQVSASPNDKMTTLILLSDVYLKQSKNESARKTLQEFLSLAPESSQIYARWFSLVDDKIIVPAKSYLQKLQQSNETLWQPCFYLALIGARLERWDEVEKQFNQVLQKTSDKKVRKQITSVYNAHGFQLYKTGELSQAQTAFMKSLGVDADDRTALYYYVQIALKNNQIDQAKKIVEQDEPRLSAIRLFLWGLISEKEGHTADALKQFRSAWKLEAFDLYAEKLYSIYLLNHDEKAIVALVTEWNRRLPESTHALLLNAMLEQEQGKNTEAIASYEKLLSLQADNIAAINNLAWLYMESNSKKAEELAANAYKLAPKSVDVMDTYAAILIHNQKYSEAKTVLLVASGIAPENKSIKDRLAVVNKEI